MQYEYLSPPSKVRKVKFPKNYVYEEVNGEPRRRLFAKLPYYPHEAEQIAKIKDYLQKKSPYINYPDELLLRFCYAGSFLISRITEQVKLYDEWHENQLITRFHKPAREILQNGHIYSYGRDSQFCPNLVVRVGALDLARYSPEDYFSAVANLLDPLEQHMLVPGVIEKWNLLVDFENRKPPVLSPQLLLNCLAKISGAYPFRLKRLLFLNSSSKQEALKDQVIGFLEKQGSQARVMVIGSWQELGRWVPEDEREKKYGGSLPDLVQFWPIHTTNKYEESEDHNGSEDDYESVLNDQDFFRQETTNSCCGHTDCRIY